MLTAAQEVNRVNSKLVQCCTLDLTCILGKLWRTAEALPTGPPVCSWTMDQLKLIYLHLPNGKLCKWWHQSFKSSKPVWVEKTFFVTLAPWYIKQVIFHIPSISRPIHRELFQKMHGTTYKFLSAIPRFLNLVHMSHDHIDMLSHKSSKLTTSCRHNWSVATCTGPIYDQLLYSEEEHH